MVSTSVPAPLSQPGDSSRQTFQTHPTLLEWSLEPELAEGTPAPSPPSVCPLIKSGTCWAQREPSTPLAGSPGHPNSSAGSPLGTVRAVRPSPGAVNAHTSYPAPHFSCWLPAPRQRRSRSLRATLQLPGLCQGIKGSQSPSPRAHSCIRKVDSPTKPQSDNAWPCAITGGLHRALGQPR